MGNGLRYRIHTAFARSNLKPRREPYWHRISSGLFVGFRKLPVGEGTWIARYRAPFGRQQYRALGELPGLDDAIAIAMVWGQSKKAEMSPAKPGVATVESVCKTYVARLRVRRGEDSSRDAQGRFERRVFGTPFGAMVFADLRSHHVRDWRDDQVIEDDDAEVVRRSKDSVNRNLTSLKAAFNEALRDQLVETDAAWRAVEKFPGVGQRRSAFLAPEDRRRLLASCPRDLAILVRTLLLTLARPGEMANADVGHLDVAQGTLFVTGKTGSRWITLSSAALRLLKAQAKGRGACEPLLTDGDGLRWSKEGWKRRFKDAARSAGLSDDVVLYTLRHVGITEMVAGGVDSHLVAKLAGTSTKMIDQHYGHVQHSKTREHLDAVRILSARA
ncbi:MAG: site-specific integrase [Roseateles sp.]|nr:MAG: site-specific integrase [Roseateles sp.]